MEKVTYKITGKTPLLMANPTTVDPLSSWSRRLQEYHKMRKAQKGLTTEQELELRRLQWEAALYLYNGTVVIPSSMLRASMAKGAAKHRKGKDICAGVFFDAPYSELEYSGPKDLEGLYSAGFVDVRVGKLQGKSSITIVRPKFEEWAVTFGVEIDRDVIDSSDVDRALDMAGKFAGIGAYRVSCRGDFGSFVSERV